MLPSAAATAMQPLSGLSIDARASVSVVALTPSAGDGGLWRRGGGGKSDGNGDSFTSRAVLHGRVIRAPNAPCPATTHRPCPPQCTPHCKKPLSPPPQRSLRQPKRSYGLRWSRPKAAVATADTLPEHVWWVIHKDMYLVGAHSS